MKHLVMLAALTMTAASAAPALNRTDRTFVNQAVMGNNFEIQAAQIAEHMRTPRAVQTYARDMIRDHTQLGQDVKAAVQHTDTRMVLPNGVTPAQQQMLIQLSRAGRNFDRLYQQFMVQSHADTYALFRTYTRDPNGNRRLERVIRKALPTVKMHWDMAERLPSR